MPSRTSKTYGTVSRNHVLIDTTRHATEATGKFESFASKPFAADFG